MNLLSGKRKLVPAALPAGGVDPAELLPKLRPEQHPVFLDSAGGPAELSSCSYLAWNPFAWLECAGGKSSLHLAGGASLPLSDHPLEALREALGRFELERGGLRFPFAGGAIGWFSYDLGRWIEKLPPAPPDDLRFPDIWLGFYDSALAVGRESGESAFLVCEWEGEKDRSGEAYRRSRFRALEELVARPKPPAAPLRASGLRADHSRESYVEAVRRAKEYIFAGDIYQVNLSQRFDAEVEGPSSALYERLRRSNPAPYAAFLSTPGGDVLSSSPELFLRVRGRRIETRPIKGTRPRSGKPSDDARARSELLASEKDRAELTMIVDLERNDLKRVCETGSVRVPRLYGLEEYETVFHLVATVEGRLREEVDLSDCLRAAFPGGSVTGAPKIRAMEIVSELERSARSVYTGAIGWIGFDGDAELNVAIRTMLRRGSRVSYRVGGGIVADSDPEAEYEETLHKGRGLARALEGS